MANLYSFDVSNCVFTIDKRYKFIKVIGKGAYGTVISCRDTITGKNVAIKKISRAFEDVVDAKRLLREIKLLRHLQHENTIGLLDIIRPAVSVGGFEDVYMVLELMETDLHRIIHSKQPLSDDHVQFFIVQVLKALKYIHSAGVLHRDLKPSNLLVNSSCDLKICDFGLARGVNDEDVVLTEYVVTRWYRAPEVMLASKNYTYSVDIWSTGCILAELMLRRPLFKGDDYIHQLFLITELIGTPTEEDIDFVTSERAKKFIRGVTHNTNLTLEKILPSANPDAVDLLKQMLTFNPNKRITVDQALNHPYLAEVAGSDETITCPSPFNFCDDEQNLDAEDLRELVWKEICHFHPEALEDLNKHLKDKSTRVDEESATEGELTDAMDSSSTSELTMRSFPTSLSSSRKQQSGEEPMKRHKLEDTITPAKTSRFEPNLFPHLIEAEEKREAT